MKNNPTSHRHNALSINRRTWAEVGSRSWYQIIPGTFFDRIVDKILLKNSVHLFLWSSVDLFCFVLFSVWFPKFLYFFLIKRNHHYQLRPGVKASLIPCNLCDRLRNPLTHTYFFCSHMGSCFALIYMLYKAMERGHPFFFWVYTLATHQVTISESLSYTFTHL